MLVEIKGIDMQSENFVMKMKWKLYSLLCKAQMEIFPNFLFSIQSNWVTGIDFLLANIQREKNY